MQLEPFMYLIMFLFQGVVFALGFFLGGKYEQVMNMARTIKKDYVPEDTAPIPAQSITKEDMRHSNKPKVNFLDKVTLPTDPNAPKGRVMKYPSPEVIRKRHEEANENKYHEDLLTSKREGGSFVR